MNKSLIKNQIIVIHIDALRREYLSSWFLAERLKKNGFRVLLTSRHSTAKLLNFFTPDAFISTHVFQLTPEQWQKLKSNKGNAFINEVEGTNNVQGVSSTYPAKNHKAINYNYKNFSKIFVWNNYTKNWLIKNRRVSKKTVLSIGSIRLSKYLRTPKENQTKTVGILSRFELINTFDNRHFFENLMTIDPESKNTKWYYERCAIDSEGFSIAFKLISSLASKGYKVIMRPHPNENLDAYSILKKKFKKSLEIDTSYAIEEWIAKVSRIFGPISSASAEAYLSKVPIISTAGIQKFKPQDKAFKQVMKMFGMASYTPSSVKKAIEMCLDKSLKPKKSNIFNLFLKTFYKYDVVHDPIDLVVENILSIQSKKKSSSNLLRFLWARLLVITFDLCVLVKRLCSLTPFKNLKAHKMYNFNCLLHRPSAYMLQLKRSIY